MRPPMRGANAPREGAGLTAEALALFGRLAALSVPATSTRQTIIDRCIRALIACGAWAKRDAYYLIGANELTWRQNWKQDLYNLTLISTPTFVADSHVVGNGSSTAYDTNFNPTTAVGAKYQRDDCSMALYAKTDLANGGSTSYELGQFGAWLGRSSAAAGRASSFPQVSSTKTAGDACFPGYVGWSRSGSALWAGYGQGFNDYGGLSYGDTAASAALNNNTIRICAVLGFGWGVNQVMAAAFGGNLTAAEHRGEKAAIRRYLQDIGAMPITVVGYGDSTALGTGATNWSTTWLRNWGDAYATKRLVETRGVAGYSTAQTLAKILADGAGNCIDQILAIMDLPAAGENVATWTNEAKAIIAASGASKWIVMPPAQDTTGGPVQVVSDVQAILLSDPFFAGHTLGASRQAQYLSDVSGSGTRSDNKHFNDSGQVIQAAYAKEIADAAGY